MVSNYSAEKVTVFGGGNIGTQVACISASKGYEVTVFSSRPAEFGKDLEIVDESGEISCRGSIARVTDSIETAMQSKILFVAYPSILFSKLAARIEPFVRPGQILCLLPGTGGAEFFFHDCVQKGAVLCGLQRVPAVARLVKYGKRVRVEGKREHLYLASVPSSCAEELSAFISGLFDMPCTPLAHYLEVTMTPSNSILHTSRLATMFGDYTPGRVYERMPLFYGDWTDASSEHLLACDAEHQRMLGMLDRLDLSSVKSMVLHYDSSDTPAKMTAKLSGIRSLNRLPSPMIRLEGGWIPDFESRYFSSDFPYGLAIIESFGRVLHADIPKIEKTMQWYRDVTGNRECFELSRYGVNTPEDIYRIYL